MTKLTDLLDAQDILMNAMHPNESVKGFTVLQHALHHLMFQAKAMMQVAPICYREDWRKFV